MAIRGLVYIGAAQILSAAEVDAKNGLPSVPSVAPAAVIIGRSMQS
jgi:hypothetical protein